MMTFRAPHAAAIERFLDEQRELPLTYAPEGMTRGAAPAGYKVDQRDAAGVGWRHAIVGFGSKARRAAGVSLPARQGTYAPRSPLYETLQMTHVSRAQVRPGKCAAVECAVRLVGVVGRGSDTT